MNGGDESIGREDSRPKFSNRDRKALAEKIKNLGKTEHDELLRILKLHAVAYTQNNNGVFVNMSAVSDDVIGKMVNFVEFCMTNMRELDDYDKRLNDCKTMNGCPADVIMSKKDVDATADPDDVANGEHQPAQAGPDASPAAQGADGKQAENRDDWAGLVSNMATNGEAVSAFRNTLLASAQAASSAAKKKVCTKFNLAKKKYSKKRVIDSSKEKNDLSNDLCAEAYA